MPGADRGKPKGKPVISRAPVSDKAAERLRWFTAMRQRALMQGVQLEPVTVSELNRFFK